MTTLSFEQFAERYNISMAAKHVRRAKDAEGWEADLWAITLRDLEGSTLAITFRMGTGHNGERPVAEDVLCSLAMDAQGAENAVDFEDWAHEYGYDTDSRKAEAIYTECQEQTEQLRAFLGAHLFEVLLECEEEGDEPEAEEVHQRFERDVLPEVKEQYEQDGEPDWPARREAFNDWTDALCKDGTISEWLYENIEHPACCGGD